VEEGPGRGTDPRAADASGALCGNRGGRGGQNVGHGGGGCWAVCYGLSPVNSAFFELNRILSKGLELIQLKMTFQCSNKFQIKYGCEGFQQRNNFLHRNFFIFKMDFELKFGESQSVFEFSNLIKIVRNGPKI
jgi:hypothetical protein